MTNEIQFFTLEWWQIFLAGLSTIAIFSFLYRENVFFRLFEHFYIGIATGLGIMATIKLFLWPRVLKPMLGFDSVLFPDGTYAEPFNNYYYLFLIPMFFGSLYYLILTKRWNWVAQVVIGFQLGVGGGMSFKGTFNEMYPQLTDSFRSLYIPGSIVDTVSNWVFCFALITSLSYFFFTFRRTSGSVVERSSACGRWVMMGCFGAFFGSTIMARMALLVERLDFLLHDWVAIFFPGS